MLTVAVTFGFALSSLAAHLSGQLTFSARMNGAQEVPAVTTNGAGVTTLVLNGDRDSLCISSYFGGLGSNVTGVHLHKGALGENGGVVLNLSDFVTNNSINAVITGTALADSLIEFMLTGDIYINVHTEDEANGEIRGQVKLETDFTFSIPINGANEVPPAVTPANGLAVFNLSLDRTTVRYWAVAEDLSGVVTGAHLHYGNDLEAGGVAYVLDVESTGHSVKGSFDVNADIVSGTPAGFLDSLFQGNIYINMHTSDFPAGEVRGNLALETGIEFDAAMDTIQEGHDVISDYASKGVAQLSLNADFTELEYYIVVDSLTGPITGAHLHNATAGNDGPVLVALTVGSSNVLSGTITGADLTDELIHELLESAVYINVHTADNANGEVRGQVNRVAREGYTIRMDGSQEVPAVVSDGTGGGIATINRERDNVHLMVVTRDLDGDISGAHLHEAAAGSNGPVIVDATSLFTGNAAFSSAFGYLTITPTNEAAIRGNGVYLNIHNMQNMDGEIRGQVYRGSECFNQSALGINEEAVNNTLTVYPNPTGSTLTVAMDDFETGTVLNLVNLSGQVVKTIVMTTNGQTIDMNDLNAGVYFLNGANTASLKVVKM